MEGSTNGPTGQSRSDRDLGAQKEFTTLALQITTTREVQAMVIHSREFEMAFEHYTDLFTQNCNYRAALDKSIGLLQPLTAISPKNPFHHENAKKEIQAAWQLAQKLPYWAPYSAPSGCQPYLLEQTYKLKNLSPMLQYTKKSIRAGHAWHTRTNVSCHSIVQELEHFAFFFAKYSPKRR